MPNTKLSEETLEILKKDIEGIKQDLRRYRSTMVELQEAHNALVSHTQNLIRENQRIGEVIDFDACVLSAMSDILIEKQILDADEFSEKTKNFIEKVKNERERMLEEAKEKMKLEQKKQNNSSEIIKNYQEELDPNPSTKMETTNGSSNIII